MQNLQPKIEIIKIREQLTAHLHDLKILQEVMQTINDSQVNFIRQEIEQTIIHLVVITANMKRLEEDQNSFWSKLN